jgi:mannitol/fructose-specific phosphotransferase system IIA component (Ntr-type)
VVVGESLIARQLSQSLRRAGVQVVEMGLAEQVEAPDPADPRFADALGVVCIDSPDVPPPQVARFKECVGAEGRVFWARAGEGAAHSEFSGKGVVHVWEGLFERQELLEGLAAGRYAIDVFDCRTGLEQERFGEGFRPLFWVKNGNAAIVHDPTNVKGRSADYAVVLRRKLSGLAQLINHIQVFPGKEQSFDAVALQLLVAAQRQQPSLLVEEAAHAALEGERKSLSAVGGGLAIPHAYIEGLPQGSCYLGIVPEGLADLPTPDNEPVRMICLLLSPADRPGEHLESLATLSGLGLDRDLFQLLSAQTVPELVNRLLSERA